MSFLIIAVDERKVVYEFLLYVLLVKLSMQVFFVERESVIDITEPCRYPVAVGLEKEYIPDENMWASSQTNNARGPSYGRLRGWKGNDHTESRPFIVSIEVLMLL